VAKTQELGYQREWELLQSLPGFRDISAANVLAEVGPDMQQFGSEKHPGFLGLTVPRQQPQRRQEQGQ
jgi:hypothetical protein